jgi:DNA-binding transcriptional MocR family regulator
VIAQEVARHGACRLFIEKVAALAGVTRSTVKRALKEAHGLGLIRIEERRLTGWRNDANVVTITDPAWLTWLRMRQRGEGSRKGPARNTKIQTRSESRSMPNTAFARQSEQGSSNDAPPQPGRVAEPIQAPLALDLALRRLSDGVLGRPRRR